MENLKLDELIVRTAWAIGHASSPMTENEKNIVRAIRKFFKMDVDRFNNSYNTFTTLDGHLPKLKDKDPITKILCRYAALHVAWRENEGQKESNLSDAEIEYISKITNAINIPSFIELEIREDITNTAYKLVNEISVLQFLNDQDLLDLIDFEKEDGLIFSRSVKPLLQAFFASLEKNNLFDTWEENYLALTKYKSELQDMFGNIDLKEFDTRYKELKSIISIFKKDKADREKQLAKENEAKEKQLAKEKADREKQLAKENEAKEKQLAKEKAEEEKNKTHEYSVSNGIDYCRYCGYDKGFSRHDCLRQNSHKYSVKRVEKISLYSGKYYEFEPICTKCGKDKSYSKYICGKY
jgi:hypothetical protein